MPPGRRSIRPRCKRLPVRAESVLYACLLLAPAAFAQLPVEPARDSGNSVTGAFEGWFKNADGSFSLLLGYYNRNRGQTVDIPVGPNNRIEPGGPDHGQPTHFVPGRAWGLFAIKVPADFGDKKLTWTLVANGKTTVIPASLKPDYEVSPLVEAAVGNTPPTLSFESFDTSGKSVQGPGGSILSERSARTGQPLSLTVFVSDDAKFTTSSGVRPKTPPPPVTLHWIEFRGPAPVVFASDKPNVEKIARTKNPAPFDGQATTMVTFPAPGEYWLHVTANDYSGEGGQGFQCCWTNAQVKVTVTQ